MKAQNFIEKRDYVCLCDREEPQEKQTVWEIGTLTLAQESYLDDHMYDENGIARFGTNIIRVLNFGLKGVRNFSVKLERNEKVGDIIKGIKPWKDECLQAIHIRERRELATAIRGISELTEDEIKK